MPKFEKMAKNGLFFHDKKPPVHDKKPQMTNNAEIRKNGQTSFFSESEKKRILFK